jgi:methyl-accepting chemotaxis protein
MMRAASSLERLRRQVAAMLTALAFVHVPILGLVAYLRDQDVTLAVGCSFALALVPALLLWVGRPPLIVAAALTVTFVAQTSQLVFAMSGHAWQVEMHFYYFAVLAMLAAFCDWRILVLAAALVAFHHLGLNDVLPNALYNGDGDVMRVFVHAVIVAVETAMLIGIGLAICSAFETADRAQQAAEISATELQRVTGLQRSDLASAGERAAQLTAMLERFKQEMSDSLEGLHEAAGGLRANADQYRIVAASATAQSVKLSVVSENTAQTVNVAAGAGADLAQSISEVGANAARSSQLAAAAVCEVEATSTTFADLAAMAQEIGDVTGLISGIAAKTNLLALNATIEAARAGESGRGFAVVAQEVKTLAGQTAKATLEIAQRIGAMRGATERSVSAIQAILDSIKELDRFSALIASSVEEQARSARQIAGSVNSAAADVDNVSGAARELDSMAERTASAVTVLTTAAQEVAGQTATMRERVRRFTDDLCQMRA